MSKGTKATAHAVIDGSNLATEGRKEPSLSQLDEAVRAIDAEYDFAQITVIVDATFEHRVAKAETKAARSAIDDGDILTPPAGVIGRGDAFILQVADRADAVVFSNDSFQEFHGTYDWLFDEGRLIGGKPVPGVGWIYVARSPVRGPVSRRATADSRRTTAKAKAGTKETPSRRTTGRTSDSKSSDTKSPNTKSTDSSPDDSSRGHSARDNSSRDNNEEPKRSRRSRKSTSGRSKAGSAGDGSNDPGVWEAFKADFPVGSTIATQVDRFSSHGAYGSVDDVVVYLPNRLLGDPAPTKARDVIELGDTVDFVVHRYDDERNGIDAGLIPVPGQSQGRRRPAKKAAAKPAATAGRAPAKKAAAKKSTSGSATRKTTAKRTTARSTAKKTTANKTTAKKTTARSTAKKTTAKKTTAKKTTANKATARKTTSRSTANKTAAKKTPAKRTAKKATKKAAKRR